MKNLLLITITLLGISISSNAQAIAAGNNSSYFLCTSGFPIAWGENLKGQLGNGDTSTGISIPSSVKGVSEITAISAGYRHSLFLKSDGTVWAAGLNERGQLGDGTTTDKYVPIQVSEMSGISAIAAGSLHSLFLKNDGSVWACGINSTGSLGDETSVERHIPVMVSGLSGITAIAAGTNFSLFLKNDGTVWACGLNNKGQLGDGTTATRFKPIQVSGLSSIISISAGGGTTGGHSLFLKNDGTVWACGQNVYGQLGDGTTTDKLVPDQVDGLSGITSISAGSGGHSLFLKNDGTVWACGYNSSGQLGNGTNSYNPNVTPTKVNGLTNITAIEAGMTFSLFLENNGAVWACGYNLDGQLGDGSHTHRHTPVQIDIQCGNVSVEEVDNQIPSLIVYPNPANHSIVIEIASVNESSKESTIEIYNTVGKKVYHSSNSYWDSKKLSLDISFFSSGVYFIRLFDGKNQQQGRFVKK